MLPEFTPILTVATGWRGTINAKAELILSAGVIQSPQILMLSGIGDKSTLEAHGIDTIIDSPNVGQHIQDHPIIYNHWTVVDTAITTDPPQQNATILAEAIQVYRENGSGPLSVSAPNRIAWDRRPTDTAPLNELEDPTAGPNTGHIEYVFLVRPFPRFAITLSLTRSS
jgi:choline dehydrogenase-like flavoprotein